MVALLLGSYQALTSRPQPGKAAGWSPSASHQRCQPGLDLLSDSHKNGGCRRSVAVNAFFGLGKTPTASNCSTCKGKQAVTCSGCKGSGRNKKNGNLFERWKCYDCQGFGLVKCPKCGKAGLTPEQRGER